MITTCPNCAIASAEECPSAKSEFLGEANQLAAATRHVWQGMVSRMDSLNLRVRYVLAFMIGAVITAAALRHGVHVYAGIAPEEIRKGALVAIAVVALAIIVLRKKRQR
jgi:ABC-type proline/glycine betaine transport system permease subunit